MFDRRTAMLGAAGLAVLGATRVGAQGRSHTVQMITRSSDSGGMAMEFSPRLLRVASGDSVTFVPSHPGHNCLSTPGMIPAGAQAWRGQIGQPVTVTFTEPGYYGYHCLPHRSLGMVGLVIVDGGGRDTNLQSARSIQHPGKAKAAWEEIWAEALG